MTLAFHNPGVLDSRLITLFGASVKPNSTNPIGFFGTGLKYAIAVTLRLGGKIELHAGGETITISQQTTAIRDKQFSTIFMRDSKGSTMLGFTTELGKTWEPWMAYRELLCNALDEGGGVDVVQDNSYHELAPNSTTILI